MHAYDRMAKGDFIRREPIIPTSEDSVLRGLVFESSRNTLIRRVESIRPRRGDFVFSGLDSPKDAWPVARGVFDHGYVLLRPGSRVERAPSYLVPLVDVTSGDANQASTLSIRRNVSTIAGSKCLPACERM